MPLRIYNSLTRQIEEFVPRDAERVQMFVCGPTVYDLIHLGNARTFTVFDTVARWLRHNNFDVTYVQNITDVDDRIIQKAATAGVSWKEIADRYANAFREDMAALGNTAVTRYAPATEHIPQVIAQVKTLIAKGHAYRIDGDGWYFDLATFPSYGKLSGRTSLEAEDAVSRIDDSSNKRNVGDFALWKFSKPGEPVWEDTELGAGRPGWHIEDTAITEAAFGPQYDLHGGGLDLKFPHHEAEIAQQEAASGKVPFVKYWMHAGFLELSSEKMSKSKGNIESLHAALEQHSASALRFFLLSGHYRAPLDYSEQGLIAAGAAVQRIGELLRKQSGSPLAADATITAIEEAMDDDFNTPKAFASMFEYIREANRLGAKADERFVALLSELFGIVPDLVSAIPDEIQSLIAQRQSAREQKDFAEADRIRDDIASAGYIVDDTPYGPLVKRR